MQNEDFINNMYEMAGRLCALKNMLAEAINREDWSSVDFIKQRLEILSTRLIKLLNDN